MDICSSEYGCDALIRLLSALRYYHKFDLIENKNDRENFSDFIFDIYTNLINDYIHLVDHHSHQMQEIYEELHEEDEEAFECDFKTCKYTTRHHNRGRIYIGDDDEKQIENNKLLNFYVTTLDSLHFYLFHLYDSGMRVKSQQNEEKQQQKMEDDSDIFDFEFSRICTEIKQRRSCRKAFDRFKNDKKFTISTSKQQISTSTLILDHLLEHLSLMRNKSQTSMSRLFKYIEKEEFDTESVEIDTDTKPHGNISIHLKNQEITDSICHFFETLKGIILQPFILYLF